MLGRRTAASVHVAILFGLCAVAATGASAASSYGPPVGWPSLANATLQPADFGAGARVSSQGYVKPDAPDRSEFDREFGGATVAGKRLLDAEDDVSVAPSVVEAGAHVIEMPLVMLLLLEKGPSGFDKLFHNAIKFTYVKGGKAVGLGAGDDSIGGVIRLGTKAGEIRFLMGIVLVRQVYSTIVLLGEPRGSLGLSDLKRVAKAAAARTRSGMAPQTTSVPTVSGTPGVGQVLTAASPAWLGTPTATSYAWERCDAAGANCTAIVGGTASTYTVSADDANTTLRVAVSATNSFGTSTAVVSVQTAVVAAPTPATTTTNTTATP